MSQPPSSSKAQAMPRARAPLSDAIIIAVSKLVDDAQLETREPSHSEIESAIHRASLSQGDPRTHGNTVGKAKRVRATLQWALDNAPLRGEELVAAIVILVRTCGGFRQSSSNYVGTQVIQGAQDAFKTEGYILGDDGDLSPTVLDSLSGTDLTEALAAYVRRAKRGSMDAALLVGTGKDLLEATAAHILMELYNNYSKQSNFPTLLGQSFLALGLSTSATPPQAGESPEQRFQRSLYDLGCATNALRNKQGTGHGRPWEPSITPQRARMAIEAMGLVAGYLLDALARVKSHSNGR